MSDITAPELRVEDTIVDGQANVASAANDEMAKKTAEIDEKISKAIEDLAAARDARIFPLFLDRAAITDETVEDVFEDLREKYKIGIAGCCDRLDVVLESGGGSIDAAYNIGLLLRRYAAKELNIIIPRWAKSAATVIACAGDEILMTPIAELGPVDPQITMFNPLEERLEEFSPLDIDSTLSLIRDEFQEGHKELAQGLLQRLQFPLTLGGIKKSLEVGTHYITRLLATRMLKGDEVAAKKAAECLVKDYSTHAFCIDIDEARRIGLKAGMLPDDQIDLVWKLRKLRQEKIEIEKQKKQTELEEMLKNLPPDILNKLLNKAPGKDTQNDPKGTPTKEN